MITHHSAAELQYKVLDHEYALSYENATFDAVIAAGVLEHVPMEYESLKELSRVTKPGGVLVITFLPNSRSLHELRARRCTTSHINNITTELHRECFRHDNFLPARTKSSHIR